jgi:glucose/arabinose dehydrogenase
MIDQRRGTGSVMGIAAGIAASVAVGAAIVMTGMAAVRAQQAGAAQAPKTYHITAKDIGEPTTQVPNPAKVVPKPADVELVAPAGFKVEPFAEGFKRPRWVVEAPNGDIFISDSTAGSIYVLRDANKNQKIEESERTEFATGLTQPFGMDFGKDGFYVANTDSVVRFPYKAGDTKASGAPTKITDLPSGKTGHWTRTIRFAPDGKTFYVTVGSSSNVDVETDPIRATILRFNPDGTGREVIATGVRNAIGFDFHPQTKEPWMAIQERDGLGDDLAPDFVAKLKKGAFYGWPYAYAGQHEDPRHKGEKPELVKTAVMPDVLVQPHSAIMGMVFYNRGAFPEKYRGGAFAALRGSSGRSKRTGYKIIYLPFVKGQATGSYEDFVTGWMLGEDKPEVWGRPVGLAVLKDGSMLITEDANGTVFRVSYAK